MSRDALPPQIGQFIKVHLPGESLWVIVRALHPDGTWEGEINNHPVAAKSERERAALSNAYFGTPEPLPSLHDFKFGQIVCFRRETTPDYSIWVPAEGSGGQA